MIKELFENKEKKVEYIELIYDLIFVYIIGRNNQILHHFEGGFFSISTFLAYALCTLAIIQIWSFSTFYINMFGRNGAREYIFLFINMYLLYFIGESTQAEWEAYQAQYHIAWGLILVNIGVQYLIEMRNQKEDALRRRVARRMFIVMIIEAAIVFVAAVTNPTASIILSAAAVFCGVLLTAISKKGAAVCIVDFEHLTERAMLYVVFTFGEMIIAVASYFTGGGSWNWNTIYFSLMAFLIVVGLFLSYGYLYDYLIDREGSYDGMLYMVLHIFIIFSLNNITASLEFMREESVELIPKMLFLIISLVLYFVFLLNFRGYTKCNCKPTKAFIALLCCITAVFIGLMILLRENMYLNILISVIYVFGIFLASYFSFKKRIESPACQIQLGK